jgi:hypothetical protein
MMGSEARAFRQLFPQWHIPVVLTSIFQAGETLRKKTANDREDWITRRLYARIIQIYPFRDGPLGIHLKQEIVYSDPDADTPAGEIDLLVSCGLGYKVCFALEAKRLRVRSSSGRFVSGNDEYVKNGIMRFVTGQYAPFMEASAMLGYVYDGETDKARSGIDRYIKSKATELKLKSPKRLMRSSILPDMFVDETRHDLKKRSFTIYHIFFAV